MRSTEFYLSFGLTVCVCVVFMYVLLFMLTANVCEGCVCLCVYLLYVWGIGMQCIVWYVYGLYVYVCAWCVYNVYGVFVCIHKFVCVSTHVVVRGQLWLLNLIFHS